MYRDLIDALETIVRDTVELIDVLREAPGTPDEPITPADVRRDISYWRTELDRESTYIDSRGPR